MDKPLESIVQRVDQQGGLTAVTLGDLRDLLDKGRLGRVVLEQIATQLTDCGLGYFPQATLKDHDQLRAAEEIRVYRLETSLASLIEAVTQPSAEGDVVLRDSTGDAAAVVEKIRKLVA